MDIDNSSLQKTASPLIVLVHKNDFTSPFVHTYNVTLHDEVTSVENFMETNHTAMLSSVSPFGNEDDLIGARA